MRVDTVVTVDQSADKGEVGLASADAVRAKCCQKNLAMPRFLATAKAVAAGVVAVA